MIFSLSIASLIAVASLSCASPTRTPNSAQNCTTERKITAIQQEIKTISSHSTADAQAIPLASNATRTFVVVPTELHGVEAPVNVGFDAASLRLELVTLGTLLEASVPPKSVHFIPNKNGSVTSDFVQVDNIGVLPRVNVREIHEFDADCKIETILGYVHGDLVHI